MFRKPPAQSQSISGTQITGSQIQMGQAGRDQELSQAGKQSASQQGLSGIEVVKLLGELETAVKTAGLSEDVAEETLDYLKPAKREAGKENADKDLVAQNLKKVGEVLNTVNKATDTGKNLWQKAQEVFQVIAPWLDSDGNG